VREKEQLPLSPSQIKAAATAGHLWSLTEQLVRERRWDSMKYLLSNASLGEVSFDELVSTLRTLDRSLGHLPTSRLRSAKVGSHLKALRAIAGNCLAKSLRHDPLTQKEQAATILDAELLLTGGKLKEAAELFERAGEDDEPPMHMACLETS